MVSTDGQLRTLLVMWEEPTDLYAPTVSYVVRYGVTPSTGEESMEMTSDETLEITGLSPFTSYSITVQACSGAGCGPESLPVAQLTEEEGMCACCVGGCMCGYMGCMHVYVCMCCVGGCVHVCMHVCMYGVWMVSLCMWYVSLD